jgi:hypothetical protein
MKGRIRADVFLILCYTKKHCHIAQIMMNAVVLHFLGEACFW